jgi:hypothetical protein
MCVPVASSYECWMEEAVGEVKLRKLPALVRERPHRLPIVQVLD